MATYSDPFDIVISFDTTYSMYDCLENVKDKMRGMIRILKSKIPDIQMGVIAHGDYDTDLYLIRYEDLTSNSDRLCSFVSAAGCNSGSTWDECYELALRYSRTKISWRENSSRTLVIIGDCRAHEVNDYQNKEKIDWETEILALRDMNIRINAVQCLGRNYADSFYRKIASATFGHYVSLTDFSKIEEVLVSICFREAGVQAFSQPASNLDTCLPHPVSAMSLPSQLQIDSADHTETESEGEDDQQGMICVMCHVGKPPNEFPSSNISEECDHAPLECLRCVVKHVHETGQCPAVGCNVRIDPADKMMEFFEAKLARMFMDYSKVLQERTELLRRSGEYVGITPINGDTEWVPYNEKLTIRDLKQEIGQRLNLRIEQQRFVYNDTNLKSDVTLAYYNIGSGADISLILPLYCIPENLDHVVFDLSWNFPTDIPDFLDATCMAFSEDEFIQVIDWTHSSENYYLKDSIKHSERNLIGPGAKSGHQALHVYLKKVPQNITHLYFTLSSWRSPNLSAFRNPSLKFYEASEENINLCETTFTHALNSQAVIMCSAVRAGTKWQIFECGAGSLVGGNAKCYNPIRARIAELIKTEL